MNRTNIAFAVLLSLFLGSCGKEEIQTFDCSGLTPTYTENIKSIIDANCATSGCHNATARQNGIDLSTYSLVVSESNRDRFLGSIQQISGYDAMPQGRSKLSDANIQLISCWIENGQPQ
ncbi:hypothetical protein [Flavilitoribacter nigricans]|uniref:Cytochrome C Planctomycete-type domain-containing protein n=1 Tax=Flavilitoribacter nigricans (strain ATCC 23147 / DSM 23189 / NBRC 102662 / NCIMB 1420 / SS-2) TaxID=1122177 RepID=A0A2D0NBE5_FLAN2|nr:hypothetical protein [Flavilitoribacter nigricans]PHN05083.1 hypothetical protein CRP01_18845 [Flavilitoribacter nigricans DSM 23189 = NBRC 102662]